jgi:hypothetical protein
MFRRRFFLFPDRPRDLASEITASFTAEVQRVDPSRVGCLTATLYRLLGHERVALTGKELETLVQQGILTRDTKVIGEGETFAVAIGARREFRHLKDRRHGAGRPPGRSRSACREAGCD